MHPQTYLKTFWRMELRPQVFVAMSFASQYEDRFNTVIAPAIRSLTVEGKKLEPYRVDISKSGDSIDLVPKLYLGTPYWSKLGFDTYCWS